MFFTGCTASLVGGDELINLDNLPANNRLYGGAAGVKIGLTLNNENWLVKFPGNLKSKQLKGVDLSYSNSPVCEYLGSHVYELLGIPVHETQLATRDGKTVVMCKDFRGSKDFYHFSDLKATFEPAFVNQDGITTDGCGTDLDEALLVIREHHVLRNVPGVEYRFWQMFVVDFIIGNPDRNNGNWGILVMDNDVELAPVYDCGNSFCDKWDDVKMRRFLSDNDAMRGEAYGGKVCFFSKNDKRIKPYRFLRNTDESVCRDAICNIIDSWEERNVFESFKILLENTLPLSETQREFYYRIVSMRIEKLKEIVTKYSASESHVF